MKLLSKPWTFISDCYICRGWSVRERTRDQLQQGWLKQYGGIAADKAQTVSARTLAGNV